MSISIKSDEFTAIGDFIKTSFERDLAAITARYPKLNQAYFDAFLQKLGQVKALESAAGMENEQKATTKSLYNEADQLNRELNFLSDYLTDAGIDTTALVGLKQDLMDADIEGAVHKIETVRQLITANKPALVEEGMHAEFDKTLDTHRISLAAKNALQNKFLNNRRTLANKNKTEYEALYAYISKIANSGKRVFDDTITEDEYTISKIIKRMRAAKRKDDDNDDDESAVA